MAASPTSVTNVQVTKNGHNFVYYDFFGRSIDSKPTTGVFNGSTYLEAVTDDEGVFTGTWNVYVFEGNSMEWLPLVSWEVDQ